MTLRKITIDNSVRYVSKDNHSHSEQALPISKEIVNQIRERKMFLIINFHKILESSLKI